MHVPSNYVCVCDQAQSFKFQMKSKNIRPRKKAHKKRNDARESKQMEKGVKSNEQYTIVMDGLDGCNGQ